MLLNVGILLMLLSHGYDCKDKKQVYLNHEDNFRNIAVSENYVFVGGNKSFIYRLTPSLEQIDRTSMDEYPTNWLLITSNDDLLTACNYKSEYLTICSRHRIGETIDLIVWVRSLEIEKPSVKYMLTTMNGKNVVWISSSSCLYYDQMDKCRAISSFDQYFREFDNAELYTAYYETTNKHVEFKTALQKDSQIYFLFNENQTYSKLGKMCSSTSEIRKVNTYEDMYITCSTGDETYKTVKDALFWNGDLLVVFVNDSTSIICRYTINNIKTKFMESRQQRLRCPYTEANRIFQKPNHYYVCYNDTYHTCENRFQWNIPCPEVSDENGLCNARIFGSIEGNLHLIQDSVIYEETSFTGLFVKMDAIQYQTHAVLYVGTDTGKVGKIFINREGGKILGKFKTVQHLSPVLDIKVNGENVYVLTENMVVNVAEHESCHTALTCEECMRSENTFCGWNLLMKICSKMDNSTDWWLPSAGGKCLRVLSSEHLISEETDMAHPEDIIVTFELEPSIEFSGSVQCNGDKNVDAVLSRDDLKCTMRVGEDPLSFNLTVENITVAAATVNLYKCSSSKSCSSCVNRKQCSWCLTTSSCVENSTECPSQRYSNIHNLMKCPGLQSTQVFISKGRTEDLRLEVSNIDKNTHTRESLRCAVGQDIYLTRLEDGYKRIVCLGVTTFSNNNITVQYKGVNLDNTAELEVYECQDFITCGSCQYYISRGYRCTWCGICQSSHDVFGGGCQNAYLKDCNISVTDIKPKSGPLLGGTKITIYGHNIGNPFDNITVTINGIECSNVTVIQPSSSISCVTGIESSQSNSAIIVTVNGISGRKAQSHFIYKDQIGLLKFTPNTSIIAGGRKIKIFGQNIGYYGSTYDISFCNNRNCVSCRLIEVIKSDDILCEIESFNMSAIMTELNVTIDHNTQLTLNQEFQVLDNPMMLTLSPEFTTVIRSGGSKITIAVIGVQNVGEVKVDNVEKPCLILSDTNVVCEAPPYVKSDFERRKRATGQNIYVYFDNYKTLLKVHYVDDPIFVEPQNLIDYEIDPRLVLVKGMNLLLGARVDDFVVHIGLDGTCRIVEITNDNLTCFAPYTIPKTNLTDRDTASIVVQVGIMRTYLGIIRYSSEDGTHIRNYVIISVLTGLIMCAIVGIVVGIIVKRRTTRKLETHVIQMNEVRPNTQISSNNRGYEISDGEGILDQYHQYSGMEDGYDRSGYDDLGIRSQDNPYERLGTNTQVDS